MPVFCADEAEGDGRKGRCVMNQLQEHIFNKFCDQIVSTIFNYPVLHDAIGISTPLLDEAGARFSVYITKEGQITDGGATLNMFRSLMRYQDYLDWPFRLDYLDRYGITEKDGELICEDEENILLYAQGLSRLQSMFEAHPLGDERK